MAPPITSQRYQLADATWDNFLVEERGKKMTQLTRRTFLGAALFPAPYQRLAAALRKKVKITNVKCMIVRGTWDWNLVKIETDSGLYGIGEAYWGPGVKDLILTQMKPLLLGEDPLNVDKLYTKVLMRSA